MMCSKRKCRSTSPHPRGKGRLQEAVTWRCKEEVDRDRKASPQRGSSEVRGNEAEWKNSEESRVTGGHLGL